MILGVRRGTGGAVGSLRGHVVSCCAQRRTPLVNRWRKRATNECSLPSTLFDQVKEAWCWPAPNERQPTAAESASPARASAAGAQRRGCAPTPRLAWHERLPFLSVHFITRAFTVQGQRGTCRHHQDVVQQRGGLFACWRCHDGNWLETAAVTHRLIDGKQSRSLLVKPSGDREAQGSDQGSIQGG